MNLMTIYFLGFLIFATLAEPILLVSCSRAKWFARLQRRLGITHFLDVPSKRIVFVWFVPWCISPPFMALFDRMISFHEPFPGSEFFATFAWIVYLIAFLAFIPVHLAVGGSLYQKGIMGIGSVILGALLQYAGGLIATIGDGSGRAYYVYFIPLISFAVGLMALSFFIGGLLDTLLTRIGRKPAPPG